jgi:hypothetical protein
MEGLFIFPGIFVDCLVIIISNLRQSLGRRARGPGLHNCVSLQVPLINSPYARGVVFRLSQSPGVKGLQEGPY